MASKGISVFKFVGTVSLGLMTGLSYSLSTLTIPALLTLPSASSAARAFETLSQTATRRLNALSIISYSAFAIAYVMSPRHLRHPYLAYSSLLVLASNLAVTDFIAPYYLSRSGSSNESSPAAAAGSAAARRARERAAAAARARMEASYEVLGDVHSEEGTAASVSGGEDETVVDDNGVNGEEVRAKVEVFLKKQGVQGAISGLGFVLAVVGIWGDGSVY